MGHVSLDTTDLKDSNKFLADIGLRHELETEDMLIRVKIFTIQRNFIKLQMSIFCKLAMLSVVRVNTKRHCLNN